MIRNQLEPNRINAVHSFKHKPCRPPVGLSRASTSYSIFRERSRGLPGHRRAEATPSFGRLCPAMTPVESNLPPKPFGLARQIDGLHLLELDAAILDEIVQRRIGRTRDLHAIKVD